MWGWDDDSGCMERKKSRSSASRGEKVGWESSPMLLKSLLAVVSPVALAAAAAAASRDRQALSHQRHEDSHQGDRFKLLLNQDPPLETLSSHQIELLEHREVENCVPFNVRSWILGTNAVVEWETHRTLLPMLHQGLDAIRDNRPHQWHFCSDDATSSVRFKPVRNESAKWSTEKAISYVAHNKESASHKAWIKLENAKEPVMFFVGSKFHGWSNLFFVGQNHFVEAKNEQCAPKQVHTAFGSTPGSFHVQWMTHSSCQPAKNRVLVRVGFHPTIKAEEDAPLVKVVDAQSNLFVDIGPHKVQRLMHVAKITGLKSNSTYSYRVGSDEYSWSIVFFTKTAPSPKEIARSDYKTPMRVLITGDLGYQNAMALPMMQAEVAQDAVDAVVSVGDYAYDLNFNDGRVGDVFMELMEPIAARVPFMVTPGNHEIFNGFSHYTERFRLMPSNSGTVVSGAGEAPNNWFYSVSAGLVHWVFITTEIYFSPSHDEAMIKRQLEWLQRDLELANQPKQRQEVPWIVVVGHRPFYCTSDVRNCLHGGTKLRDSLEDLFHSFGVDLYICGHQHNYERMYDIYRNRTEQKTTNMRSTTHIITGASGQYHVRIMRMQFQLQHAPWDAFRNAIMGYSRLSVVNATHLHWQQVESDVVNPYAQSLYGRVIDDVWLVQEHHGSFGKVSRRDW